MPSLYQTMYVRAGLEVNKCEKISSPFQTIWDTQTQKRGTIFLSRYLCVTTYIHHAVWAVIFTKPVRATQRFK